MPNWITAKLAGYVVAGLLASGVLLKVYSVVENYFTGVSNTRIELANERIKRERSDTSLALLRATVELQDEHDLVIEELRFQYDQDVDQLRLDAEAQIMVLEDRERLARVTSAKPKLVEKLANRATKERFNELETIINN